MPFLLLLILASTMAASARADSDDRSVSVAHIVIAHQCQALSEDDSRLSLAYEISRRRLAEAGKSDAEISRTLSEISASLTDAPNTGVLTSKMCDDLLKNYER